MSKIHPALILGISLFCAYSFARLETVSAATSPRFANVKEAAAEFLPEYERVIGAKSKCLDFGSATENAVGIEYTRSAVSGKYNVAGVTYRELKLKKTLDIEIPAFNVDSKGFPLTPMLLQVRFKDTIDDTSVDASKARARHRAFVYSRIDYITHDPAFPRSHPKKKERFYKISHLGGFGDGRWRYMQYGFGKTPFQLLRAINGKFTIRITMPRHNKLLLPIDYVMLRAITQADYATLVSRQRRSKGFYWVQLPPDRPASPISYPDPNLVVFVRDIMRPIYKHTRPKASEISKTVTIFSAPGETEPATFGIYTKSGIDGLTLDVSNFVTQSGDAKLTKNNILVTKVVYSEKRLAPYHYKIGKYSKAYSLIPDHLEEFSSLHIEADSSERIWLKVKTPKNLSGGLYKGNIFLRRNGRIRETIEVRLKVLPLRLVRPENINPVYGDPYRDKFLDFRDAVFKLYAETGFDPFLLASNHVSVIKKGHRIVDFDTEAFEAHLDRMINEGFIKKSVLIQLSGLWANIYYALFGDSSTYKKDALLYERLSNKAFIDAFSLAMRKLIKIGDRRDIYFVFSVIDEPGDVPYRRIIADKLYTIIKSIGAKTTVTYSSRCDKRISSGRFKTPMRTIASLTNLVDYKTWRPLDQGGGYAKNYPNYGYYTTNTSYLRNPIYNRFLHGLLAFGTDAKIVSAYAMLDIINDPFNDFDAQASFRYPYTHPDFVFAYPTWTGKLLPTMALEGIREGITDAKYIATLKRLIMENPTSPVAVEAQSYLRTLKNRINPDYWNVYVQKSTDTGYYQAILKDVSQNNCAADYEAFTRIRRKIYDYIYELTVRPN